jgi:hypothetical protein
MPDRFQLVGRDPLTYRRKTIGFAGGWDETTSPDILAVYIAQAAATLAREWTRRYNAPFPSRRMEWTVEREAR